MYSSDLNFQTHDLEQRSNSGARWFFWIAGLSIITSIVSLFGGGFVFFLSLGTTQFVDGVARGLSQEFGDTPRIVALIFDLLVAGVFALMGWFALKRHLWGFVVGMSLFLLDAMLLLIFQIWLSFAFHLLVVYWIFKGYQAARQLAALERHMEMTPPPLPPAELGPTTPAVQAGPAA